MPPPEHRQRAQAGAGEAYNPGPPTRPRQAASVLLLRGGDDVLEVLLVQRTTKARFMGGVWVFPGGAVDADDGDGDEAHRAAAIRELHEEAAIDLDGPAALIKFSRWITPAAVLTRFDTHFFLASLPAGQEPAIDGSECVDLGWFTPQAALDAYGADEIELVFPTIKHLEQLRDFTSVTELLAYARERTVQPIEPKVVLEGEVARILLPGDPGY
jgi:8-oxo-dGTP pyrophosphatase MutT (NUDIX family)